MTLDDLKKPQDIVLGNIKKWAGNQSSPFLTHTFITP